MKLAQNKPQGNPGGTKRSAAASAAVIVHLIPVDEGKLKLETNVILRAITSDRCVLPRVHAHINQREPCSLAVRLDGHDVLISLRADF